MMFRRPSVRFGCTPEPETPYQRAAQVWDERIGSARVQARNWRLIAFGNLSLALGLFGCVIWQSARSTVTRSNVLDEARQMPLDLWIRRLIVDSCGRNRPRLTKLIDFHHPRRINRQLLFPTALRASWRLGRKRRVTFRSALDRGLALGFLSPCRRCKWFWRCCWSATKSPYLPENLCCRLGAL
jgi:VirB8 protein